MSPVQEPPGGGKGPWVRREGSAPDRGYPVRFGPGSAPGATPGPTTSAPPTDSDKVVRPSPKFFVSAAGSSPAKRQNSLLVFAIVLGAGVLAFAALRAAHGPDPHFAKAQRIIADYELGREENVRDYEDPAYQQALTELGLVAADSTSADPAGRLAADIRRWIDEQRARVAARESEFAKIRERNRARNQEMARRQEVAVPIPKHTPECEEH